MACTPSWLVSRGKLQRQRPFPSPRERSTSWSLPTPRIWSALWNLQLINNQQRDNKPDSPPDTTQAAAIGGTEVNVRAEKCVYLRLEKREGKLLQQLHRGSLGFPVSLWNKHCSLFTLQADLWGDTERRIEGFEMLLQFTSKLQGCLQLYFTLRCLLFHKTQHPGHAKVSRNFGDS